VPPHEAVADESKVVRLGCCNWLLEVMRKAVVPVFHGFGETQCLFRGETGCRYQTLVDAVGM
jgi:hypothetical protein